MIDLMWRFSSRTFRGMSDPDQLRTLCHELSLELAEDLRSAKNLQVGQKCGPTFEFLHQKIIVSTRFGKYGFD